MFANTFRFFQRNQQQPDEDDPPLLDNNNVTAAPCDDVDIIISRPQSNQSSVINIQGNNVLNANLSGSFRDDNGISSSHLVNATQLQPSTSNGSPARIGVAALPNLEFLSRQSQARNRLI